MEGHRVKALSMDPRSRNRFRFASTKQREQRATADVYRGYKRRIGVASSATREEAVHHSKEPDQKKSRHAETAAALAGLTDLQSASLAEEVDLANDRNASEIFGKFYRETWSLVRSLPEILHHREKIVQLMLDYLLSPEEEEASDQAGDRGPVRYQANQATTDILHLLAVLARDLRHEIHPYLHSKILPRLVDDLLNPPLARQQQLPTDVTILESCLRTLSYLFRYDAETLVTEMSDKEKEPCLEAMRPYYGKMLAHRREVVRRMSAEALAPLIRRLKESGRKRHVRRVFRALAVAVSREGSSERLQTDVADGIARLCLELVKGVSGRLHSKADALLKTVLECSCARHGDDSVEEKVLQSVGHQFLYGLCGSLKTPAACVLYQHVVKFLDQHVRDRKDAVSTVSLLRLSIQIASYSDGVLVRESESIFEVLATLAGLFEPAAFQTLPREARATAFDFLCLVWRANPSEKKVTLAIAEILKNAIPVLLKDEGGDSFFLGLLTDKVLPVLSLELSMRTLGSILLHIAAQEANRDFTFSLILALASAREEATETDTVMFLENAVRCDVPAVNIESLLDQCLLDLGSLSSEGSEVLLSTAVQCSVFVGMLACKKSAPKKGLLKTFKRISSWLQSVMDKVSKFPDYASASDKSLEVSLCFSLALESLARFSSVVKGLVGETNAVKDSLVRIRDKAARHLEVNASSIWAVKSCALYAQLLHEMTGKMVIDDSNKVFDILVSNLSRSSHFLRLHCLEILLLYPDKPFVSDHADLDLTGDLDEEPSTAPQTQESSKKSSISGVCHVLHTLLEVEQMNPDFQNERRLNSLLSAVDVQARSGKMPILYVEATIAHMLGLFHVRFSPLWPAIQSTIVSLIEGCDKYAWPHFQEKLAKLTCSSSTLATQSKDTEKSISVYDGAVLFSSYLQWDQSSGLEILLWRKSIAAADDDGRVSRHLVRRGDDVVLSIWGALEKQPQLLVSHSRQVVPVSLGFLSAYFYRVGDPDAVEMNLHSHVQSDSTRDATLGRKSVEKRMLAMLKVFAKVNGPQQMHKHSVLFRVFVSLLGYTDIVAQTAFSAILRFKPDYIVPYSDPLKKLFAKGRMREAILQLKASKNDGTITREHRKKLIPLVTRILLGRVSAKNTSRSAKDSPSARRTAIFSFLGGFCEGDDELYPSIYLAVRQFAPPTILKEIELQSVEDQRQLINQIKDVSRLDSDQLPAAVQEGFLNVLEAIVSQLGHRALQFVPAFISILLWMLESSAVGTAPQIETLPVDDGDDEDTELNNSRSSRIRTLCFRRLAELFERFADVYDFSAEANRLWDCIGVSLKGLPESSATAEKCPALLSMLVTLSSRPSLIPILRLNEESVRLAILSLEGAQTYGVVDAALSFIENLLAVEEDSGKDSSGRVGPLLIQNQVDSLLRTFKSKFSQPGGATTLRREIRVLCGVSNIITAGKGIAACDSSDIDALCELLVPYLGERSKLSEADKSNVISVCVSLVPGLTKAAARSFYLDLSRFLGPPRHGDSSVATRFLLAEAVHAVAKTHLRQATPAANLLLEICAVNSRRVGELDYDSSLSALQKLSKEEGDFSWSQLANESIEAISPLIQVCFQLLHDEDGVLSRSSLKTLRVLVDLAASKALADNTEEWLKVLEGKVIPLMRSGLQTKTAGVRRLYVVLLADIAKCCKDSTSPHLHGDLAVLLREDNPDLDFFQGMNHVQVHRRAKAFTRLRHVLAEESRSSCQFSAQSLSNVLLPLVLHPLFESKSTEEDTYALEAVATVGSIARLLSWAKYNNLIGTLLNQFQRHPEQEKYLVGAICSVIDNMDFDLGINVDAESQNSAVMRTLEKRIIPKTEELLVKEVKKAGNTEKSIRPSIVLALLKLTQKFPREAFLAKLHRLLAVICDALKNRDSNIRDLARSTLSKMAVAIDSEFLADIVRELAVSLKEGYQLHVRAAAVHSVLLEFSEKKNDVPEPTGDTTPTAFDRAVPALVDLIQQDLFGGAQERKEAEDSHVRHVKESGGSKSLHSLELIASMIQFDPARQTNTSTSSIHNLVSPFLERLNAPSTTVKGIRRLKECLERIAHGIAKNKNVTGEKAYGFAYATIDHNARQDFQDNTTANQEEDDDNPVKPIKVSVSAGPIRDSKTSEQERASGTVSEWRPSTLHMTKSHREASDAKSLDGRKLRTVQDGQSAPKLTGSGRGSLAGRQTSRWSNPAHTAAVVFGLQIFQIALRKDTQERSPTLLDPFVRLLTDCVCSSRDTDVLRLSMKSFGSLLSVDLPSLTMYASTLSTQTVDLLASSGGNEELQHSCFKLLTFLLQKTEDREGALATQGGNDLTDKVDLLKDQSKMDLLISFIRQSVIESEQHSQAISLLKAILACTYSSPDLYDLMECILEQSVRSPKESLRQQCSSVYLSFLMNYPMSEDRLEQELKQVVLNMGYEHSDGRLSAINIVNSIASRLPIELLEMKSQVIFLPLTMQLANEVSDECRRAVAKCIKTLLGRLSTESCQSIFEYACRWAQSQDRLLRRTALQLYGLFLDSSLEFCRRKEVSSQLQSSVEQVLEQEEDNDWEVLYFSLSCLEKASAHAIAEPLDGSHSILAKAVVDGINHEHVWVQLVSTRLLWNHLKGMDPRSFNEGKTGTPSFLVERGTLYNVGRNLCGLLSFFGEAAKQGGTTDGNTGDLLTIVIKALSWLLTAMDQYPSLCYSMDNGAQEDKSPTRWLMKRLSGIAKPKYASRRKAVFQCFAAFIASGPENVVKANLDCILEPLHRVEREAESATATGPWQREMHAEEVSEEVELAREVLQMLESKYDDEGFLDAYSAVRKKAKSVKEERRREEKTQAARDPKWAAERKIHKNEQDKQRRKRRVEERRRDRGGSSKRRNTSS